MVTSENSELSSKFKVLQTRRRRKVGVIAEVGMKLCRMLLVAGSLACAYGADGPVSVTAAAAEKTGSARDTGILTLPGGRSRAIEAPKETPAPPPERPKPELPQAFKNDGTLYLQGLIGVWKKANAEALLGPAVHQRPAYDQKAVNGQIYAFADPTGNYREFELDFDSETATLRTVFAYPKQMSWEECRKLWGDRVNATHAPKGRTFYSYLNRKMDVLVDRAGKVISLGLY